MARITTVKAQELWSNHNNISPKTRFPDGELDANSVWFPLSELDAFIAELKNSTEAVSGVRIYFGKYGNTDGPTVHESQRSTLFLSATKLSGNSGNSNDADITTIQPLNFGSSGWPPYIVYPKL